MTAPVTLSDDLTELLGVFLSNNVEFMVTGAYALALYGRPRFTEDLNLFVRRTEPNAKQLRQALQDFGIGLTDEGERQFYEDPRALLVIGNKPHEVDIMNFLDGVEYDTAMNRAQTAELCGMQVPFIGIEDLVACKRASGRPRDLDDLAHLQQKLGSGFPEVL